MREITYKMHFPYAPAVKKRAILAHFLLDVPYLISRSGIIPEFPALNERLLTGGNSGGMSHGITWRPFQITHEEYDDIVSYFLNVDVDALRANFNLVSVSKFRMDD